MESPSNNLIPSEFNSFEYKLITGNIYTANKNQKFIDSMIIHKQKIIFTGDSYQSQEFIVQNNITRIYHLNLPKNKLILPGFIDSHIHPLLGGVSIDSVDFSQCVSSEEIKTKLQNFIFNNISQKFIFGKAYFDSQLPKDKSPLEFLDEISNEIPIVIIRFDCHTYWCNSYLLKLAGVTKDTNCPEGGMIQKDSNGELAGVFHDAAMSLLKKAFPKLSIENKVEILEKTLQYLMSLGITGFMDAAVSSINYEVYERIYLRNIKENVDGINLNLPRCALSMAAKNLFVDSDLDIENNNSIEGIIKKLENFFKLKRIKNWDESNNYKFKVNAVKLFIDGVFESGTAMFNKCKCHLQNENNNENKIETYTYNKQELEKIINYLYTNDIQIHCHCIGDLATKMVIDEIENNFNPITNTQMNYIAHLQLVTKEDITRMKHLKIQGNMSPYWFQKDDFSDVLINLIGEDRLVDLYPIRKMIEEGITIGFGSDWPVSTVNPLEGIEVAVTHRDLAISDDKPSYNIENIISLEEAVDAYTINSAKLLKLDSICGSLENGKFADFIILDKNIFKIKNWHIHKANVENTFIDGKLLYNRI